MPQQENLTESAIPIMGMIMTRSPTESPPNEDAPPFVSCDRGTEISTSARLIRDSAD